ncbi:recombinase family protein [Acaryochloris marina NIES-2412]|uniref:recombinase family protein n=1 Tax=Acaryochloris marina TaxID=155978 RepID=UPI0040586BAD
MQTSELVTPQHLSRKALIYIRQSSPNQLINNQESLKLQYSLQQRALDLGWDIGNIETIDSDLGITASSAEYREGFKEMIAQVTLGKVGIILSYDVTRLSRNCSDWYPLLDLCGYRSCLIADRDGVYDPGSANGRLLLGLKGQISELELHTIRARLRAGALNKAQRGELEMRLPVGLVRDEQGHVHKHPNQEVQDRISLVFTTFLKVKASSQVVKKFHQQQLMIPRQNRFGDIMWQSPSTDAILSMLKNPAYAGAFVYGRTETVRSQTNPHKLISRKIPFSEWKILVKDKYPAYISWEIYELIQAQLKDNYAEYNHHKNKGIPRQGAALIHGLTYCGECGHKMMVQYRRNSRYICNFRHQRYHTPVCQSMLSDRIDEYVVQSFFEALSPIELDAYTGAVNAQRKSNQSIEHAQKQQLERFRYQASLAERQYNQVDPDNRLVAAELERRWEDALRELKVAEETISTQATIEVEPQIPAELKTAFMDIGKQLPEIWSKGILSTVQKKSLLRCLIDKVVLHRVAGDIIHVRIVWKGGEFTQKDLKVVVGSISKLSNIDELERRVIALNKQGYNDQYIADTLSQEGFHSPSKLTLLPSTVQRIRLKHRVFKQRNSSHPRQVPGYLTIPQLAATLNCSSQWIHRQIKKGIISVAKDKQSQLYLFPDQSSTLSKFQELLAGSVTKLHFGKEHQDAR